MQELQLDFEWPVAERYQLRPIEKGQGPRPIAAPEPDVPFHIVAHGELTWRRPLEKQALAQVLLATYRRFEDEPDQLQQTALAFASEYGLLFNACKVNREEGLDQWQGFIDGLIALHKAFEAGRWELSADKLDMANIRAALVPDPLTHAPRLAFRPFNLGQAINLQLAHRLARGGKLKTCVNCGGFFEAGLDGKRGDAKFCSEACRFHHHNRRKRA